MIKNEEFTQWIDTSDEWIKERTGISERHVVTNQTACDLASEACLNALENAGKTAEDVDMIIIGTISMDHVTPSLACEVQKRIGAKNAVSFDINGACAGFLFALDTAAAYLNTGRYKSALVVGVEILSKIVDWTDRTTCVLFGDGAGAAYVEADETRSFYMVQGTKPDNWEVLNCKAREIESPFADREAYAKLSDHVYMNGREVYQFAVTTVPKAIQNVLEQAHLEPSDISCYILHQANVRIIQSVAKRLGESMDKFPVNMMRYGNMSSASMPVLLDEIHREGRLEEGKYILLSGFGAGLVYGATILKW
ncbi:MAG: ketoacyl-ACP synthase III [Lachnospiraceae bacterium]|nr:ketoacyl-ACP synthase III [Lachnospiraceae bacterium]